MEEAEAGVEADMDATDDEAVDAEVAELLLLLNEEDEGTGLMHRYWCSPATSIRLKNLFHLLLLSIMCRGGIPRTLMIFAI